MSNFLRTLTLLEAHGVPLEYVDMQTILHLLKEADMTPEAVVHIVLGNASGHANLAATES